MELLTKEELKQLSIKELLRLRFHEYKMVQRAWEVNHEIEHILFDRKSEFTDDDIAHLMTVFPHQPRQIVFKLYNDVLRQLPDDYPYRYRFVNIKLLDEEMKKYEVIKWLKGDDNAKYFGRKYTYYLIYCIIQSLENKEDATHIATLLTSKRTKFSGLLLLNSFVPDEFIPHALKNISVITQGDIHSVEFILDKDLLNMVPHKELLRFFMRGMKGNLFGRPQFQVNRKEMQEMLFPLSVNEPDMVSKILREYDSQRMQMHDHMSEEGVYSLTSLAEMSGVDKNKLRRFGQ